MLAAFIAVLCIALWALCSLHPSSLKYEGISMSVLTSLNFCCVVFYGRPVKGIAIAGLVFLCVGTGISLVAFGYRAYHGPGVNRNPLLVAWSIAFALDLLCLILGVVDMAREGLSEGDKWTLAVGIVGVVYSGASLLLDVWPWEKPASATK